MMISYVLQNDTHHKQDFYYMNLNEFNVKDVSYQQGNGPIFDAKYPN